MSLSSEVFDAFKRAAEFAVEKAFPGVLATMGGPFGKMLADLAQTDMVKGFEEGMLNAGEGKLQQLFDKCVEWFGQELSKAEGAHPAIKEFVDAVKPPPPFDLGI